MSNAPIPEPPALGLLPLTAGQRRGMLIIAATLCLLLALLILRDRTNVADPAPQRGERADELLDGIDPNTADAATLAALPNVGPGRAEAIFQFRQRHQARTGDPIAFRRPHDLLAIPGIGTAVLEQIEPHLRFPRETGLP